MPDTATRPQFGLSILDLTDSQIEAIRNLPALDEAKTPILLERRPVDIFMEKSRFELEQKQIFRKEPVVIAPTAALPDNSSVAAFDGYGIPVLLTRDKDGVVRAFLNACTHKGATLHEGCKARKTGTISCPYHAWTFSLDGTLRGVPRPDSYENFDKSTRPLTQLPCKEAGGLIWAILDPKAEADFSSVPDQIADDFDAFRLGSCFKYGYRRFELKANWKLVMEPFLEGYHVQRLHATSIGPQGLDMFADVVGVQDRIGRHIRQTNGRGNFDPDLLDNPSLNIRKIITHAYNIFPNVVVITSPYYTSVMIIMPKSESESSVDYYMLTDVEPNNDKAEELFAKSFEVIQDVFGNEDFKASETCQQGLSSGAIPDVIYCGMEAAIPMFYEGIEAALIEK